MSDHISLHGNRYYEELKKYKDLAFEESHWLGKRRRLGGFVFGVARAEWESVNGGRAHLREEGIHYNGNNLTSIYPTKLYLYDRNDNDMGFVVTRFDMDVDDIGLIQVTGGIITRGTMREVIKMDLAGRREKRLGLKEPTDEDRILLYEELKRGASGMYPYDEGFEDDDEFDD